MLTNLTFAAAADLIISATAIRQPPTAPPSDSTSVLQRGA
jgi:hypothetical protein